jgi:O-antigen/teichoic acid export membrane protein
MRIAAPSPPEPSRSLGGLFKHTAIYGAVPLVRQAISVAMVRLYTQPSWLGTAGYGVKEIVDLWIVGLQQLLGQNVLSGMVRFYFDHQDEKDRRTVVTSSGLSVTGLAWIVCGAALLFTDWLSPLLLGRGEVVPGAELERILGLTLLLIPFQLSTLSGLYYLQILKRSGLYSTIQTAKLLVEVGANFWLIGGLGLGVRGFLLSMLLGEAACTLLLTGWMLATLGPRLQWRLLRPVLVYALPLIPVGICQFGLHQVDRRLLLYFSPEGMAQSATGIYGLGYKVGYITTAMMLGPFIQSWQPWIFAVEDRRERSALVARVGTYAVLAISAASLGIILLGRQAVILLAGAPEFHEAYRVVPFVTGGYVFWALYQVSQYPLFIAKRTARLLAINLAAIAVNLALNSVLIPRLGFVGAGCATLVTFAFLAGLGMLASRSEADVPFELKRLGTILACVLLAGACALWLDGLDASSRVAIPVVLAAKAAVLAGLLALLWLAVLKPEERASLRAWARRRAGQGSRTK